MNYDHITKATDERLADMLEKNLKKSVMPNSLQSIHEKMETTKIIEEAAERIRNIQRILNSKVPFNNEQFE